MKFQLIECKNKNSINKVRIYIYIYSFQNDHSSQQHSVQTFNYSLINYYILTLNCDRGIPSFLPGIDDEAINCGTSPNFIVEYFRVIVEHVIVFSETPLNILLKLLISKTKN